MYQGRGRRQWGEFGSGSGVAAASAHLADFLAFERIEIADSLGIPIDRDEEGDRIVVECDSRHRPSIILDLTDLDEEDIYEMMFLNGDEIMAQFGRSGTSTATGARMTVPSLKPNAAGS